MCYSSLLVARFLHVLYQKIIKQKLSVRQVEDLARKKRPDPPKKATVPDRRSSYVEDVENRLRTFLATKVLVKLRNKGGSIEIEFFTDDELERLVNVICDEDAL